MQGKTDTGFSERRVGIVVGVLVSLSVVFLAFSAVFLRPMDAFELRASSFTGFAPKIDGWLFEKRPVSPDPIEPNILCYRVTPRESAGYGGTRQADATLRLVHGYNVRDCMRIKGYSVEEVAASLPATTTKHQALDTLPPSSVLHPSSLTPHPLPGQLWRMVSPSGTTSLWHTVMLRSDTFAPTDRDVRSMPFPRVGVPDDPDWSPGGITLAGLRHPIANIRKAVRAKWNASRSDLLTFLGFRRPAWVQAEWLTLVVAAEGRAGISEEDAERSLLAIQSAFVRELTGWQKGRVDGRGE
jgi:hypothetical protein